MDIGPLLEGARIRAALSQTALASLLGVTQQTVSRWEQGASRPRRAAVDKITEVLNLSSDEILTLTGVGARALAADRARRTDYAGGASLPVRASTPVLPFLRSTPDNFERFVTDLLELVFPEAEVSQLGGQGDDQRGYDILVVHADGRRVGVQCKREEQFGAKKVGKAVAAAEVDVDESVLALARTATAEARFEIDKYSGWRLWDQADLSRKARRLPPDQALRLVGTYFPDHIEAFLGHKPVSAWWKADEYYRSSSLLDHRQPLVGRRGLADEVASWVTDLEAASPAVLVGRGGLGKSKLLWEVANRSYAGETHFRFLAVGQQPLADDFNLLPRTGMLVVVLDDAHAMERVSGIVAQVWRERPGAKVILATRPYGEAALDNELWTLGISARSVNRWMLEDLSQIEAIELVSTLVARSDLDPFVRQLASISADCPFIAIVATDLLRRGALAGASLDSDSALRDEVFRRFSSQLTGYGSGVDAVQRRDILSAVAAFQPVRLDDPEFESAITTLTGVGSWDAVNGRMRELEDAGLLLRRGRNAVRVVPDMFGDVLLGQAAYDDRSGLSTNFLARAQGAASGTPLQHLLVNASRMDWQLRVSGARRAEVVEELWDGLRSDLLAGTFADQIALLGLASRVAFYRPDRAMALVDDVQRASVPDVLPPDESVLRWAATREDVVHALAPVLRNIAYDLEHLRMAVDALWALAQHDQRPPNQYPDHPLRVLSGIADLRPNRSIEYLHGLVDAATVWIAQPSKVSPFEVLEPVLAVEGSSEIWSGSSLVLRAFGIDPTRVHDVRQRVIDLAFDQATSDDLRAAVRAVDTLAKAIRGPFGMYERQPSEEERQAWAREFLPTIQSLGQLGSSSDRDPAIRIAIRQAVGWHAEHSRTETRPVAQEMLLRLVKTLEDDLAMCIHAGWGRMAMRTDGLTFEESEQLRVIEFRRVADAITVGQSDHQILKRLERRLYVERVAFETHGSALLFVAEFFASRPSIARLLCEEVLKGRFPELGMFVSAAISALADHGDSRAILLAKEMLEGEDSQMQRAAAEALSWRRGGRTMLLPDERAVLLMMAGHSNDSVRSAAGRVVSILGREDHPFAMELLAQIEFGNSTEVASAALSGFAPPGKMHWQDVPEALRDAVIVQLVDCLSFEDYELAGALSGLSRIDPLGVTRLLLARIDRQFEQSISEYQALPDHWDQSLQVHESPQLAACLIEVRDWMTTHGQQEDSSDLQDEGSELYRLLAGGWNDQAFATLDDINSAASEAMLLTAARIIAHAPVAVLVRQVGRISTVLRCAESLGMETSASVSRALLPSGAGVFSLWRGERPKKDEEDRDAARAVADGLPRGSIERHFFERLADAIEARIEWTMDRSESKYDGREW